MAADKKIAEATQCMQKAEKSLKTGLLKWRPDYDIAASEYSRAATCFKAAKSMEQCKECLLKAAQCYSQNNSFFSAAKSYEQAAMVCRDMKNLTETGELVAKACKLFQEHGSPDTAAMSLERGAKMIESSMPEKALKLLKSAAEVVMLEDRPRQAAEYMSKVSRLLVRLGRYDEASENITKEIELLVSVDNERAAGRLIVALVLVHLTRGDTVAANKAYQSGLGYIEGEEQDTLSNLIEGFDQRDPEQCQRALSNPFIKHMDVEYSKLARDLPLPKLREGASNDASKSTENESSALDNNAEDDYENGLC